VSLNALPGDRILLCSDGLSNELTNDTLARLASAPAALQDSVNQLVAAANRAGGRDNISVVLLEFDEVSVAATEIKKTVSTRPPPVVHSSRTSSSRVYRGHRRFTWRVWASLLLFLLVLAGGVAVVHWYAYSTYYLGLDGRTVAIYQGQPKGVLWFKPTKVLDTSYSLAQILPANRPAMRATISEPTLSAALNYAAYLHSEWTTVHSITTTTTTTTLGTTTTVKAG
jgi:hypothetical protein